MNLIQMLTQQGPVAWVVFGGLLLMSLLVWTAIPLKSRTLRQADKGYDRLQRTVQERGTFQQLRAWSWDQESNPYARIVLAGASEMEALGNSPDASPEIWNSQRQAVERALAQGIRKEATRSSRWMALLATAGNVSPFIGLLGTVWGIMRSFHEIGAQGAASLAVVGPGISEALLATAAGLFAAIPAVMAFNIFRSRIGAQKLRLQDVADEVINLLERERLANLTVGHRLDMGAARSQVREDS